MTVILLKEVLDEMGIRYNKTSKKAILIELVKQGRRALEANHNTNSQVTTTPKTSNHSESRMEIIVGRYPLSMYYYDEKKGDAALYTFDYIFYARNGWIKP